jgi:hypothetical protein
VQKKTVYKYFNCAGFLIQKKREEDAIFHGVMKLVLDYTAEDVLIGSAVKPIKTERKSAFNY